MNLLVEIKEVVDKLDIIEDYINSLNDKLLIEEKKQQDLLHYIENNKIGAFQSYRLVKKIKEMRTNRRKIKNDMELASTFATNKNKMLSKTNRQFIMAELYKKEKSLGKKYTNRYYQENEIDNLLKGVGV